MTQESAWVYILRCSDGTLYTGSAIDLEARLALHQAGKGSKYTRGRRPVEIVFAEACTSWAQALSRESEIKRLSRHRKQALIAAH